MQNHWLRLNDITLGTELCIYNETKYMKLPKKHRIVNFHCYHTKHQFTISRHDKKKSHIDPILFFVKNESEPSLYLRSDYYYFGGD